MKQRPILFSTPMVRALLEGRKTQTRRVVKPQPSDKATFFAINSVAWPKKPWGARVQYDGEPVHYEITNAYKCPYGNLGDVLWVRESFIDSEDYSCYDPEEDGARFLFRADCPPESLHVPTWKPSIHMPKEACRLFLEITDIRAERLQHISEEDAKAEGAPALVTDGDCESFYEHLDGSFIGGFYKVWEKINGTESWEANPWVWVITFKRIEKPQ